MSKKVDLAEKKRNLAAKKIQAKEKFRIEIIVDDEDNVSVNGPLRNFNLFMRIINGAINIVNDYDIRRKNEELAEKERKESNLMIQ